MKRLFFYFLKDQIRNLSLYLGFAGIFYIVFALYGLPAEAVHYAFLLSFFWLALYLAVSFFRYVRRTGALSVAARKAEHGVMEFPPPASSLEEEYQKILRQVYEEQREEKSGERIARQELQDYYTMWVHQIKTPIAALGVLLQEREEDEEEHARQLTRDMKRELFKIEQYVEMVLAYLRMEGMSSDLLLAEYSLDSIVKQAVKKYAQLFILQRLRLVYEPLDRTVLTDEKWLVFVVEQVLSNALKYTKEGQISIYLEEDRLVVADTGIGIQPEDLPRIFERGFTGYNGRQDKKSTGIGLYLCKAVMDRLDHRIWVESAPGKGTKVYMDLDRGRLRTE